MFKELDRGVMYKSNLAIYSLVNSYQAVTASITVRDMNHITPPQKCKLLTFALLHSAATTDVQGVNVCLIFGSTYSNQCIYIAGSKASMCSYAFESVKEGTRDINSIIEENGSVNENIPNINDYGRILVYDKNNILAMNETLDLEKNGYCHTTGNFKLIIFNCPTFERPPSIPQ